MTSIGEFTNPEIPDAFTYNVIVNTIKAVFDPMAAARQTDENSLNIVTAEGFTLTANGYPLACTGYPLGAKGYPSAVNA